MLNLKLVDNINEINFSDEWTESTKFNSKNKFVDKQGKYVDVIYTGHKYQLVSKKERDYSFVQRGMRRFAATLIVVCTLGLVYFSQTAWKSVKKLFFKQKEHVRIGVLDTTTQAISENAESAKQITDQTFNTSPVPKKVKQFVPSLHDLPPKVAPVKFNKHQAQDPLSLPNPNQDIPPMEDLPEERESLNNMEEEFFDNHPFQQTILEDSPTDEDSTSTEDLSEEMDSVINVTDQELETAAKELKEEFKTSEKELQEGISVSEETISKIQKGLGHILNRRKKDGVKFYDSQDNHRVFTLDTAPDLIFKMKTRKKVSKYDWNDSMRARYKKMINARTVVRTHQLDLLVIPQAKLFTVKVRNKEYDIIAEKKVDITPLQSVQEHYFEKYADNLNETIRQLALFICKTGYSDVEWRNIPIINNSVEEDGNRKIALIDLEESIVEKECVSIGLFGGCFRRTGLVQLVNEEQGEIIKKIAQENGIEEVFIGDDPYSARKKALEENRKLKEFYARKEIKNGDEPIQVNIDSLGLDLEKSATISIIEKDEDGKSIMDGAFYKREDKDITLRKVTEDVIQEINKLIQAKDVQESTKGKRNILLKLKRSSLSDYANLGVLGDEEENEKLKWLNLIIEALIKKDYIFKLISADRNGFLIQC